MQLSGRTALITGAGSGIGKATARLFAQEGARVAVLDIAEDQARQTASEIEAGGGQARAVVADVSQADQMQRAVGQVVEAWGTIDTVFANAGINGVWSPVEEISPEEWDQTLNVNLRGTFLTVKYAVPYLKRQGGSVIITSSVNGTRLFRNPGASAYSASKAAQLAFGKMIALELARFNIRVNVICPGSVKTEIGGSTVMRNRDSIRFPIEFPEGHIPLTARQPATPEQVAQLVLFLASDASNHITGTEIFIDGGQVLL